MGRGRAKAKQTRVARDLKYRPIDTNFASLERELRGQRGSDVIDEPEREDPYAALAAQYGDYDDDFDEDDDDEAAHA